MVINNSFSKYLKLLENISNNSNLDLLQKLYSEVEQCFVTRGRIFFAGNGGSAAIANHVVTDFSKLVVNEKYLTPISLCSNMSQLTANSNDSGYENSFLLTIKNYYLNENDLVITISSSGNSRNILDLINYANSKNAKTFSLLGFDGGEAKNISRHSLIFETKKNYYGPVEDLHMAVFHFITHLFKKDIIEIAG